MIQWGKIITLQGLVCKGKLRGGLKGFQLQERGRGIRETATDNSAGSIVKNFDSILIGFGSEGIPARCGVDEDRMNEGLVQEGKGMLGGAPA